MRIKQPAKWPFRDILLDYRDKGEVMAAENCFQTLCAARSPGGALPARSLALGSRWRPALSDGSSEDSVP